MINTNVVSGHMIRLNTTDPLHFSGESKIVRQKDDVAGSFADMLNGAISRTNDLQIDAEQLMQKMIVNPQSVDIHQVMIAQQKAEIAIGLTKAVRDGAINAYRELINLR